MVETSETRGRPHMAKPTALRTDALDLFLRRGYDVVTMADIAREVGVSVRTLHRYFPSKADIVWGGLDGAANALSRALELAHPSQPLIAVFISAVTKVFDEEAERETFARARLRIIATTPSLAAAHPAAYRRWREETTFFVARRLNLSPMDLVPRAIAAALQATIAEALLCWAVRDDESEPTRDVEHALAELRLLSIGG